ncbi:aminotransferase class I/II-fold pyridoxal phosphate-dependent enzyme [Maribacter sp. CXY002]|uniref:aminotransferase class I/II-fold pyridoxal phosphate-dependent enzyme n=1 Tax=Maribacter luteocoastalis TaxID=3407671 RepID=UPI003B66ED75
MAVYIDSFPGREININGKPYLYFGGTSYLGLQDLPEFQELFIDNIRKYGTGYSASRKSNVRFPIFDDAENYLADLVGSERCITLSSGYLAGQFIAEYLQTKKYKAFYAPNTHSALLRNCTQHKNYVTYASLNIAVRNYLNGPNPKIPVLYLDAIDFSGGNYPNFESLKILPLKKMILVADDSHGIGIVGENGQGIFNTLQKLPIKTLFVCCSLGKGLGIQAGAVFGNSEDLSQLESAHLYVGSSPASPAAMATLVQADKLYNQRRSILRQNLGYFLKEVGSDVKFRHMEGHPTFSFQNELLVTHLEKHGIIITNFNYPNENSKITSRIVLSASHTIQDINTLCNTIKSFS